MKREYRRIYCVTDYRGIPLSNQEYMTLNEAIQRINREVEEAKKLGFTDTTDREYGVYDSELGKHVL